MQRRLQQRNWFDVCGLIRAVQQHIAFEFWFNPKKKYLTRADRAGIICWLLQFVCQFLRLCSQVGNGFLHALICDESNKTCSGSAWIRTFATKSQGVVHDQIIYSHIHAFLLGTYMYTVATAQYGRWKSSTQSLLCLEELFPHLTIGFHDNQPLPNTPSFKIPTQEILPQTNPPWSHFS